MKKLSDYRNEEAFELWADLFDPLMNIFGDEKIVGAIRGGRSRIEIAKVILKEKSADATKILTRIDPTPIDGLNIIFRLLELMTEIETNENVKSFFEFAEQDEEEETSSGSVTESTEGKEM